MVPGQRFLGGFVGDQKGTGEFVESKVQMWTSCVEKLTMAAESQPQAAYAKFLQFEWAYWQRVVPNCSEAFVPLRDTINDKFLPRILGGSISDPEKTLFSLPVHKGGMGIRDPAESAHEIYSSSKEGTSAIANAIKGSEQFSVQAQEVMMANTRSKRCTAQKECDQRKFDGCLEILDPKKLRVIMRAVDGKTSHWLSVMAVACHHFDLSAVVQRCIGYAPNACYL